MANKNSSSSPFIPMFLEFRQELDEHHDRRERVIKASRDITALSKKMIFSLQRVHHNNEKLLASVAAENDGRKSDIKALFESISEDLRGINAQRYQRQISGALQEFIEAVSFEHYIRHQNLITPQEAAGLIAGGVQLTDDDYVLGIFDLAGELMRFAITQMATSGSLSGRNISRSPGVDATPAGGDESTPKGDIVMDLRALRTHFELLNLNGAGGGSGGLAREVEKKMEVMKTCVEKVESAAYGIIIRGRERPKGWVPSLADDVAGGGGGGGGGSEPVESY